MTDTHNARSVITDTTRSPHARLRPVPVSVVRLTDTFWAPRREINRTVTLPSQYRHLEDTGRLDNFRRVAGLTDKPFVGIYFNDSDVYKWLEAAAWALATDPEDAPLRALVDEAIRVVAGAQDADGYLNTYFSVERVGERWTNLRDMHELYCAGHLFQAAVAHVRATGETSLLQVATRFADHICARFGPADQGKTPGACGHEEVEMALVELYRVTGKRRYLDQAAYFIRARGAEPSVVYNQRASEGDVGHRRYLQDHVPFRDLAEVTGHAVRMMYLTCGAADVAAETGDSSLVSAMDRQWENMTTRRMYVTGGLGARWEGEAFGKDYELPSSRAYAETCAAIGSLMWNWRLLSLTGEAKYADEMERALYNGLLAGLSLDGQEYFYQNPLADDGTHRRQPWFGCACCPPNIARLLAQLPGYFYSLVGSEIYVHLYAAGTAELTLPNGGLVVLIQKTDYPWSGDVEIRVQNLPESFNGLHLRIPGWADSATITINGQSRDTEVTPGSYTWLGRLKSGDVVRLSLPMPVRQLVSHPDVSDTRGCVALARGPLIYCVEQADHAGVDMAALALLLGASFQFAHEPELLGGVTALRAEGQEIDQSAWAGALYRPAVAAEGPARRPVPLTAIPYYAWANREPGPMRVWIPMS